MSYLRQIMQRLAQTDAGNKPLRQTRDIEDNRPSQPVADYQTKLHMCTPAMLQYEWCLLQQHIETLQLCLANTTMSSELGGRDQVLRLVKDSELYQSILTTRMNELGVLPAKHNHTTIPGEHAWEVTQSIIKENWGF
jgi:hypothetical protein